MEEKRLNISFLSGNAIKIIAALSMLVDHIGSILFPQLIIFRVIGRLAFPLFAFCIAEGCRHTRNKVKYFAIIVLFAIITQGIFLIFGRGWGLNILFTFSLSILAVYSLQFFKNKFQEKSSAWIKILSGLLFVVTITGIFLINKFITLDYGFWGAMLPVFASVLDYNGDNYILKSLNNKYLNLTLFSLGLLILCIALNNAWQFVSFFSVLLLAFYSGKRGKIKMKYFFYVFYVVHLLMLYLIDFFI